MASREFPSYPPLRFVGGDVDDRVKGKLTLVAGDSSGLGTGMITGLPG
jgi:hypothetical protein